ncbi:Ribonuclease H1, putative [Penicillium digitatum PHI26]|uniref:ribonuclease H n=3 Tax=Penicillium digitatum TaxID=36651 RepID=K9GYV9_PEND2|nr:Ribonuclease H1, putative [Penicillium digitatum Pd1]EKV05585.1 Ribonuclease H1, putative [Penicillium digitatum Pd1]EKV18166.1 Ribonuclease H1, putative [Penicillium digitatum PHI26]
MEGCVHSSTAHGTRVNGSRHHVAGSPERTGEISPADRRFRTENEYSARFALQEIEIDIGSWMCLACPTSIRKCLDCNQYQGHEDSQIIAIHGECLTERSQKRSAIGVFYGRGNDGNISWPIPGKDDHSHTTQIAELTACLRALRNATSIIEQRRKMMRKGKVLMPLKIFVIKTDSEYLVRSLTEWLPKWKKNGWKTCKGVPVANSDMFKLAETGITMVEMVVQVKFWLVPKENNLEATCLAKMAFIEG